MFQKYSKEILIISTSLFAIAMVIAGVLDIKQSPEFMKTTGSLGYPAYFYTLLGVFKIAGAMLLLAFKFITFEIRKLAYAGFIFDLTFAVLSFIAIGDWMSALIPLPFMGLLVTSLVAAYINSKAQIKRSNN